MNDDPAEESAEDTEAKKKARQRRAAELLGDLMPTTTGDETPEGWNEKNGTSREEEFLRDVPPHHG
ncbi:hypothetical protein [Aeromicrobium sp.]